MGEFGTTGFGAGSGEDAAQGVTEQESAGETAMSEIAGQESMEKTGMSEGARKELAEGTAVPEGVEQPAGTAAQVAALEEENEKLKASFEPLYTEIGRNFYEKTQGYELEITAAVQKLNEMNGKIHDNYLATLRLKGIRYCPNCENIVDNETVFCGDCGTRIDPPEEADEQSVLCGCCGAKNDREKRFCIKCGQKLSVQQLSPQQAVLRRCPSCGTQLPADARFCEECGTRLV